MKVVKERNVIRSRVFRKQYYESGNFNKPGKFPRQKKVQHYMLGVKTYHGFIITNVFIKKQLLIMFMSYYSCIFVLCATFKLWEGIIVR